MFNNKNFKIMKKISVLKLGNMNRENLKKREMNLLMGGNECSNGLTNQIMNTYSGKCSCICEAEYNDSSSYRSEDAVFLKSNGTILP